VRARIGNNIGCETWLLHLSFFLGEFGVGGQGTAIPAGGRVPRGYLGVEASEIQNRSNTMSAFYGFTELRAIKLIATTATGENFTVPLVLPPRRVRGQAPWLRSFRYFVTFHSRATEVEKLAAVDAEGHVFRRLERSGQSFVELSHS
jgi:hypothetical protein